MITDKIDYKGEIKNELNGSKFVLERGGNSMEVKQINLDKQAIKHK